MTSSWRLRRQLVAWVLLLAGGSSARATDGEGQVYASLSGTWKGSYTVFQRGRCTLGRAARLDAQVRVAITVDAEGGFQATVTAIRYGRDPSYADIYAQFPAEGDPGLGRFNPDLTFELKVPRQSRCRGVPRQFEIVYAGKVTEKKGKQRMDLKGPVAPCPDIDNCLFENVLKLTKE